MEDEQEFDAFFDNLITRGTHVMATIAGYGVISLIVYNILLNWG